MAVAVHRTARPRANTTARPLHHAVVVFRSRGTPVRYTSASGRVGEGSQEQQPVKDAVSHKAATEKYSGNAEGLDPSGRQVEEEQPGQG
jgi:hypothetical protein